MTKQLLLFASFFCITMPSFAQKLFSPGYFVELSGKKSEAFIRIISLEDANAKGKSLEYRMVEDGESIAIPFDRLVEIGVGNDIKLKKEEVSLDDANLYGDFPTNKYPDFKKVTVFLNQLIDGDASLFVYESQRGNKYFYSVKGKVATIEQLLYKKYINSAVSAPKEVFTFRQQLFDNVKCAGDTFDKFANITCERSELIAVFKKYNTCSNGQLMEYGNEEKKEAKLSWTVYGGLQSIFGVARNVNPEPGNESALTYSIGGEMEFRSSNEKWGFILRTDFESPNLVFETKKDLSEFSDDVRNDRYEIKSIFLNIAIGGRLYFNPEARNNFFADAAVGVNAPVNGNVEYTSFISDADTVFPSAVESSKARSSVFFTGAFGYVFSNHLGADLRATLGKNPANSAQNPLSVNYSTIGLCVRYTF